MRTVMTTTMGHHNRPIITIMVHIYLAPSSFTTSLWLWIRRKTLTFKLIYRISVWTITLVGHVPIALFFLPSVLLSFFLSFFFSSVCWLVALGLPFRPDYCLSMWVSTLWPIVMCTYIHWWCHVLLSYHLCPMFTRKSIGVSCFATFEQAKSNKHLECFTISSTMVGKRKRNERDRIVGTRRCWNTMLCCEQMLEHIWPTLILYICLLFTQWWHITLWTN